MNNIKKTYISPEAIVFVCKTNSLLMASKMDILEDIQNITPIDEEFNEEFSARDMEFEEDDFDY